MRYGSAITLVLAFSFGTFGENMSSGLPRSKGVTLCPSATLINFTTINFSGNDIQHIIFECPDGSLSAGASVPTLATKTFIAVPDSMPGLSRRTVSECLDGVPTCQCGQPVSCTCINLTPSFPVSNDCSTLIESFKVIPQALGATFIVHQQTFQLLMFQSCAIEWINLTANSPLEYCWDELAALSGFADLNCLEPGVNTGVNCTAMDGKFGIM
ncbi:hypothetical protein ACEPAF_1993 [Sanghuangporus sanghuang]